MSAAAAAGTVAGRRQARIEAAAGMGFSAPAFVLLLLVHVVPLGALLWLSFTDYELGAVEIAHVGFGNFAAALADPGFRRSLSNTFLYVSIVLPGSVVFGLLAAILVHDRKRMRSFYEIVYFLPVTSTLIAMATVWIFILHPKLGPVNGILKAVGIGEVAFLSDPARALPTLAALGIWQLVGFNMILFLAGLSAIPKDLYEAAEIDGSGGAIDRFLNVTWPMLGPTVMFVTVTTSITAFKVFETVAVMTQGGPMGSSEVLLYSIYLEGFQYFRMGYASALTLVFLAFILVFSALQAFALDRRVHY